MEPVPSAYGAQRLNSLDHQGTPLELFNNNNTYLLAQTVKNLPAMQETQV